MGPLVLSHVAGIVELLAAHLAGEGSLPGVGSLVNQEVLPVGVAPGTVGADVLLLLGVGGRVALQLAQVLVALPARLARKVVQLPNLKN